MREAILVFGGDETLIGQLRRALLPLKVMVRLIPKEEYGHTLGYLAGDKSCPASETPYAGEELSQPLLVLAGLTDSRTDRVLAALRRAGHADRHQPAVERPGPLSRDCPGAPGHDSPAQVSRILNAAQLSALAESCAALHWWCSW